MEVHRIRRTDSYRDQMVMARHRCDPRKWVHLMQPDGTMDYSKMGPDDDVLEFPVGIYGEGMPIGAAFQAVAVCAACGDAKSAWFVWTGPLVVSQPLG